GGLVADTDCFDASFFGYSPREAEFLDPQHRLFLEAAWEALETAGYDSERENRPIGVFGGTGMNGYLFNLYSNPTVRSNASPYELFVGNDKDFLTTRVSYKLNLRGPSIGIQTACSSSLVAVHTACQSLLSGECDMALAGGVAVSKQIGYRTEEGGIHSPDGHCRPFDAKANGTVGGNGIGIVVLKRLTDALEDGDTIDAVIKGSAVTNDGAHKVSYTAPQVDSQAAAIRNALTVAELSADTLSYVEAHGTGTPMGDPIEFAALKEAFRVDSDRTGFCALGSVKSNIGHLDVAAGIAGLIKAVLALKYRQLPPTLHFTNANPDIDLDHSPFFVNTEATPWPGTSHPLRAGVSSFGIGGTNAHVVLEEPPALQKAVVASPPTPSLLPLSAQSEAALKEQASQLAAFLTSHGDARLIDVARTLQEGRRAFTYRSTIHASTLEQAHRGAVEAIEITRASENPSPIWLFPGQGSYKDLLPSFAESSPTFLSALEQCQARMAVAASETRGPVETECIG
ncbi:MAG: type I polyketide synthase, partial [Verrucomicrobiota bacterium]